MKDTENLFGYEGWRITSGLGEVGGVGVEVKRVASDSPPPDPNMKGMEHLVAAGEMEVLLEVGEFDVNGDDHVPSTHLRPKS